MADSAIHDIAADAAGLSARLLQALYGQNAKTVAMERARELQESGDMDGAIKWLRVMEKIVAIEEGAYLTGLR